MSDSSWQRALDFTLRYEGGYVFDPNDRGGETFRGVSRRFWPAWAGWEAVDRIKAASPNAFRAVLLGDKTILQQATDFYRVEFWDKIHGDELPGKIAVAAFDMAVHSGPKIAARTLQVALGVAVDGEIGPQTIKAAYERGEEGLVDFLAERTRYLSNIMIADESQAGWARNWFRRLFKLANVVLEGEGVDFPGVDSQKGPQGQAV